LRVWPYILPLPVDSSKLLRFLRAVFGSETALEILRKLPADGRVYQARLIEELNRSNKTVINALKNLVSLGVLEEGMEKARRGNRVVWVKYYTVTDLGRWLAFLISPPEQLDKDVVKRLIENLLKLYLDSILKVCKSYDIDPIELIKRVLEEENASDRLG